MTRKPTTVHDPAKMTALVRFDHAIMLRGVQVQLLDPFEVDAVPAPRRSLVHRTLAGLGLAALRLTRPERYVARGMRRELAAIMEPAFRSAVRRITDAEVMFAFALYRDLVQAHMTEMARLSIHGHGGGVGGGSRPVEPSLNTASTPVHGGSNGREMSYVVKPGGTLPGILGGEPVGRARTSSTALEI